MTLVWGAGGDGHGPEAGVAAGQATCSGRARGTGTACLTLGGWSTKSCFLVAETSMQLLDQKF